MPNKIYSSLLIREFMDWIESGARDMDLINGSFPLLQAFHYKVGTTDPELLRESIIKDDITEENIVLRRLLWANHGHQGLYGDDGEMQCGMCGGIDFKRMPAIEIEWIWFERNMKEYLNILKEKEKTNAN